MWKEAIAKIIRDEARTFIYMYVDEYVKTKSVPKNLYTAEAKLIEELCQNDIILSLRYKIEWQICLSLPIQNCEVIKEQMNEILNCNLIAYIATEAYEKIIREKAIENARESLAKYNSIGIVLAFVDEHYVPVLKAYSKQRFQPDDIEFVFLESFAKNFNVNIDDMIPADIKNSDERYIRHVVITQDNVGQIQNDDDIAFLFYIPDSEYEIVLKDDYIV